MRRWGFAAAAGLMLAGQASALEPWRMPPYDAPSVAQAEAYSRQIVEQARVWQGDSMVAAATTTTPEVRHVPTGARCRFWYQTGEITYPSLNSRHVNCSTSRDWLNVQTWIHRRETPAEMGGNPNLVASYLSAAHGSVHEIAALFGADAARDNHGSYQLTGTRHWTSSRGTVVDYVVLRTRYPGGAPEGTRQERTNWIAFAVIGDWIFGYSAGGPVHYTDSIEAMGEEGFVKLLQSIDEAALIL
jgi:hypothetical protein